MITPAQAAWQLLRSALVGIPLGVWYGFWQPVRRRWVADLFFCPALVWAWLQVGFGICGGDLRLGYFAALALGAWLGLKLSGKLLSPLWLGFWSSLRALAGWIFRFFREVAKIFLKKQEKSKNFSFHPGKNRVQ